MGAGPPHDSGSDTPPTPSSGPALGGVEQTEVTGDRQNGGGGQGQCGDQRDEKNTDRGGNAETLEIGIAGERQAVDRADDRQPGPPQKMTWEVPR